MPGRLVRFLLPDGRVGRGAFWICLVAQLVFALAFVALGILVIDPAEDDPSGAVLALETALGIAYLACAATTATVGVSRILSRRRSAWWALFALIPYVGPLWYLREAGVALGPADRAAPSVRFPSDRGRRRRHRANRSK